MKNKFATSLIAGLVVGGAVTMFLGRKNGRQRRNDMLEEIDENITLVHDLNDSLKTFSSALDNLTSTANELVPKFKTDITKTVEAFKFQADPRVDEINSSIEQIKKDLT